MSLLQELSVAQELEGSSFLLIDGNDKPVMTFHGKHPVRSDSKQFLEFLLDDLWRCPVVEMNTEGSINFGGTPCAYAIFSDQINLLDDQEQSFKALIQIAPAYDRLPIQVANGPPGELIQIQHLEAPREALAELLGGKRYDLLTSICWAKYYAAMEGREAELSLPYEGPGTFITDDDFSKSEVSRYLFERIERFSAQEKGALIALWRLTGSESLLMSFLVIKGKISTSQFLRSSLFIGNNILNFLEDEFEEDPAKVKHEHYTYLDSVLNLALQYASYGTDEMSKEISEGETRTREFKSTFFLDLNTKTKEDRICFSAIKTIAAFLNTEGGTLFVGVSDNGIILGVDEEIKLFFKGVEDKYLLAVKEKIKQSFEGLYDLIQWELIQTPNRKKLLKIQVNRAHKPAFVLASGKEHFFVRTTPATESLEGSKMIGYIARRFSSDKLRSLIVT